MRLRATFTTTLHPAAHEKDSCRSEALSAPMKALLTNAIPSASASTRSAGSDAR